MDKTYKKLYTLLEKYSNGKLEFVLNGYTITKRETFFNERDYYEIFISIQYINHLVFQKDDIIRDKVSLEVYNYLSPYYRKEKIKKLLSFN